MFRHCYRGASNIAISRLTSGSTKLLNGRTAPQFIKQHKQQLSTLNVSPVAEVADKASIPSSQLDKQEWEVVEDWDYRWFDGRDKLHVRVKATEDDTDFRGVGFYSKEGYWMGTIRWNERLRSKDPAVWIHWVGKDPVEMSTFLPPPDSDGCYTFTITFQKREVVVHCNGEFLGERKNMIYQFKNVGRVWFADLECVKGQYAIEGPHTDDSGYTAYLDVPMFQRATDMWQLFRKAQKDHADVQYPDHGWRSKS